MHHRTIPNEFTINSATSSKTLGKKENVKVNDNQASGIKICKNWRDI